MRRTIPYLAAWFAAGLAAVALAGAGVSMVRHQVTGSRPAPLSAEDVRDELAAAGDVTTTTTTVVAPTTTVAPPTTAAPSVTPSDGGSAGTDDGPAATTGGVAPPTTAPPATTPPPAPVTKTYDLVGGTATLRFSAAGVTVVTATPKAGFTVTTGSTHGTGVRVEFESDGHRSRVDAWWDGGPQDEAREDT